MSSEGNWFNEIKACFNTLAMLIIVGRAVASNTRGPRFDSSLVYATYLLLTVLKRRKKIKNQSCREWPTKKRIKPQLSNFELVNCKQNICSRLAKNHLPPCCYFASQERTIVMHNSNLFSLAFVLQTVLMNNWRLGLRLSQHEGNFFPNELLWYGVV